MRYLALLIALTPACLGGLSNQPLLVGEVQGQLLGAEAAGATVFLLDHPEHQSRAGADGRFRLPLVPVGDYRLLALAGSTALSVAVQVGPGAVTTPTELTLVPAALLEVQVTLNGADLSGAAVGLTGTPLGAQTDGLGLARLGALPSGCFSIAVGSSGEHRDAPVCLVAPGPILLEVALGQAPPPDAGQPDAGNEDAGDLDGGTPDAGGTCDGGDRDGGHPDAGAADGGDHPDAGEGCLGSGCPSSLHCDPADGQCYPCIDDSHCSGGETCAGHACQPVLAPCTPCSTDADCGVGGACVSPFSGGPTQCVFGCQGSGGCAAFGYQCSMNQCIPQTDQISSCDAAAAFGLSCGSDGDCVQEGLVSGRCLSADGLSPPTCTVACSGDGDCPGNLTCQSSDGGDGFCQP